jgi:outer membrane protein OmpA-like peptidoglycan-associated protein
VKREALVACATLAAFGATLGCAPAQPIAAAAAPSAAAAASGNSQPPPAATAPGAGSTAGGYLDGQAQELDLIAGANVERRADALVVTLPGDALFDGSATALSDAGAERVRSLAHTLAHYPKQHVIVKGHTDNQGPERRNQSASEDRADSVRNLLVAEGMAPSRITAIGLGASLPIASNDTAEGRLRNWRVEVELRPDEDALATGAAP